MPVITFVNRRNYLNTGFAGIGTVYQGLGTARTFPVANTYYTISTVTLPPGRYLVLGSSQVSESSDLIYVLAIGNQSTRFSGLHGGGANVFYVCKSDKQFTVELKMAVGGASGNVKNSFTYLYAVKISNDIS